MSYCVNCGVELDPSAGICPLCHTPVVNPGRPVDEEAPPPFPTRRAEVQPVNNWEVALLLCEEGFWILGFVGGGGA